MASRSGLWGRALRWMGVGSLLALGCSASDPDAAEVQRCADYCEACSIGYCIAGGESGRCQGSDSTDRQCILASGGDCTALRTCLMGPRLDAGVTADAP